MFDGFIPPAPVLAEDYAQAPLGFVPPPPVLRPEDEMAAFVPPPPVDMTIPSAVAPTAIDSLPAPTGPVGIQLASAMPAPAGSTFSPPPPVAPLTPEQQAAADAQTRVEGGPYLGALDGTVPTKADVQLIQYPEGATDEQRAMIDNYNSAIQQDADAAQRAELEQGLTTATADAAAQLAEDAMSARQAQLDKDAVDRDRVKKRQAEVVDMVAEDYEDARELARSDPDTKLSGKEFAGILAIAAAEALQAAFGHRAPGAPSAVGSVIERKANAKAEKIAALRASQASGTDLYNLLRTQGQDQAYYAELTKAAMYEAVGLQAKALEARAGSNQQRVALAYAAQDAAAKSAQAREAARVAAEKARLDNDKARAEIDSKRADVDKTRAEIAKLRRQGMGGKKPSQAFGVREPTGVYVGDLKIADFRTGAKATPDELKRAAEANKVAAGALTYQQLLNQYMAKVEDYGERGVTDAFRVAQSDEYRELAAMRRELAAAYAKVRAGAGLATTETDEKGAAEALVPPDGWWERGDAETELKTLRMTAENKLRNELWMLEPQTQERLIQHARSYGVSKKDATAAWSSKASRTAADPAETPKRRAAAVGTVVDNAKAAADKKGDEDDWHPDAAEALVGVYTSALDEPESEGRTTALTKAAEEMVDVRRELRQRAANRRQLIQRATNPADPNIAVWQGELRRYEATADAIDDAFVAGFGYSLEGLSPKAARAAITRAGGASKRVAPVEGTRVPRDE